MTDAPCILARPVLFALLLGLLGVSTPTTSEAAAAIGFERDDWSIRRQEDGIEVATRSVADSKHDAVRARMTVKSSLAEVVALLKDEKACSEWAAYCAEANVLDERGETEAWIYTWNDMP